MGRDYSGVDANGTFVMFDYSGKGNNLAIGTGASVAHGLFGTYSTFRFLSNQPDSRLYAKPETWTNLTATDKTQTLLFMFYLRLDYVGTPPVGVQPLITFGTNESVPGYPIGLAFGIDIANNEIVMTLPDGSTVLVPKNPPNANLTICCEYQAVKIWLNGDAMAMSIGDEPLSQVNALPPIDWETTNGLHIAYSDQLDKPYGRQSSVSIGCMGIYYGNIADPVALGYKHGRACQQFGKRGCDNMPAKIPHSIIEFAKGFIGETIYYTCASTYYFPTLNSTRAPLLCQQGPEDTMTPVLPDWVPVMDTCTVLGECIPGCKHDTICEADFTCNCSGTNFTGPDCSIRKFKRNSFAMLYKLF